MRVALKTSLFVFALTFAATDANAWYCTAAAKNGASGWGFHFFQSESEKMALKQCRLTAKGKQCKITSCW